MTTRSDLAPGLALARRIICEAMGLSTRPDEFALSLELVDAEIAKFECPHSAEHRARGELCPGCKRREADRERDESAPLVYRVEWTVGEWHPEGAHWIRVWAGGDDSWTEDAARVHGDSRGAWHWAAWLVGNNKGAEGPAATFDEAKAAADTWLAERCAR